MPKVDRMTIRYVVVEANWVRRLGSQSRKAANFVTNYYLQKCENEKTVDISPQKLSKLREIVERG